MPATAITLLELIKKGESLLDEQECEGSLAGSEQIAMHLLGIASRVDLYSEPKTITDEIEGAFFSLIEKRAEGYPLQYVVGEVAFSDMIVQVDERALIPRPETEGLVDMCSKWYPHDEALAILDLCTGSGCIAVSLATIFPSATVTAVDVSPDAVMCTRDNVRAHGLEERVNVIWCDLFAGLEGNQFDLITVNPPYIPTGELASLQEEIHYEPRIALNGGVDGLDIVRRIVEEVKQYMKPGGRVICELGDEQADMVLNYVGEKGYSYGEIHCDFAGKKRFVSWRNEE